MNAPLYTIDILRLAASLSEPAELERVDGSAEARSPTCGSVVRTKVALRDGRIEALSQQVSACAFGQASAALVGANAVGRDRREVEQALGELGAWLEGAETSPSWPGVSALGPARPRKARHAAILLPLRALVAAVGDAQ